MTMIEKFLEKFGFARIGKSPRTYDIEYAGSHEMFGIYQPASYDDFIRTYHEIVWVFACVRKIAQACASRPFSLLNSHQKSCPNHPAAKLLEAVNPFMTGYDLWEWTFTDLELTGNCYWNLEMNHRGEIIEIWRLKPEHVRIVPDKHHFIKGYIYEVNGRNLSLPREQVIHIKYHNPASEYYGASPVQAAAQAICTDQYAVAWNKNYFKNSAVPSGILETEGVLDDAAYERLRREWQHHHGGISNAHKIKILESGLRWRPLNLPPKDMEFLAQRKLCREEILAVFGVPPMLVGLFEYANYANSREQRKSFYQETIIPKLRKVEKTVTEQLLARIDPDITGRFETAGIETSQEDREKQARTIISLVQHQVLSPQEARRELGFGERG